MAGIYANSTYDTYNNLYGIFVGIEQFPKSNKKINSLFHSNEDADELCHFFLDYCQSRDKRGELSLLTNKEYVKKVAYRKQVNVKEGTRSNILATLTKYLGIMQPKDLLLLYISTHGIVDYNDYFFIPADGDLDNILGSAISSYTLIQALGKASGEGVNVLLILDTCYSGAIGFDLAKFKGKFSCFLSSSPVEYSYEFSHIEHGIFTNFLLKGLNGEAGTEGGISLVELFDYVYKNVQESTQKKQNPLLSGTLDYKFLIKQA
jgi:uncharacterized caspase-like protein